MGAMIIFAQLVGVAYVMSIGFGMIISQAQGVKFAHRVWVKFMCKTVAFVCSTIGDIFLWLAKTLRR